MISFYRAKATFAIAAGEFFEINMETAETVRDNSKSSIMDSVPDLSNRDELQGWTKVKTGDVVNHPSHYNTGKIEVIEFIEDQKLNYHLGNTVKYIARAGKKGVDKELEDLKKAAWYLARKIEELEARKAGRVVVRPNDMVSK